MFDNEINRRLLAYKKTDFFLEGVIDGDGYVKNREDVDGNRLVVVGMDLICQLEAYIKRKIAGSRASWIKVSVSIMFMII
jgi:hypothetical protein